MEEQKEAYVYEPHSFTSKAYHWWMCSKCGLLRLKNGLTEWSVEKGCKADLHPAFKSVVRMYTK